MDYKALYRKWRPRVFSEVLGQEHVTDTLRNQIVNGNIAHGYLFSGIRGTGKTSIAKIFARAVNCLELSDGNPCNKCENCLSALSDSAIDIIEIDAASNNGVDDIRDLREKTKYPPSKMRYKVYIIDEVHMLSIGAFNALLKTLEEPPSYVVFVFATTEIHKIPATIISRCQKYELKRIKQNDIVALMEKICIETGFTFENDALEEIAILSDGAARDSLSILDQCFSANIEKHINKEVILNVLGLVTDEIIYDLVNAINNEDPKAALYILNKVIVSGKDIKRFINQLINYYRYLMLSKVSLDLSEMINVSDDMLNKILSQGKETSLNLIIRSINILTQVEIDSKWSANSRVILEVGLIKILQPDLESSIEALSERIEKLESNKARVITKVVKADIEEIKPKIPNVKHKEKEIKKEIIEDVSYGNISDLSIEESEQEDLWEDVLDLIKKRKISTHALLLDGKFEGFLNNCLCISYADGYGFHLIAVEKKENRKIVEDAVAEIYKTHIRVKYVTKSEIESNDLSIEDNKSNDEKLLKFVGDYENKLEFND